MNDFSPIHWVIITGIILLMLFSSKLKGNMKLIGQVLFTLVSILSLLFWLTGYNTPHP